MVKTIFIVHGQNDELVPGKNIEAFAQNNSADLTWVADGHRLENSHQTLADTLRRFLDSFEVSKGNPGDSRELVKRLNNVLYWIDPAGTACLENDGMADEYMSLAQATVDLHKALKQPLYEALTKVVLAHMEIDPNAAPDRWQPVSDVVRRMQLAD